MGDFIWFKINKMKNICEKFSKFISVVIDKYWNKNKLEWELILKSNWKKHKIKIKVEKKIFRCWWAMDTFWIIELIQIWDAKIEAFSDYLADCDQFDS